MALSVGTGVRCHPCRDTPFCWHSGDRGGCSGGEGWDGAVGGILGGNWLGGILAMNWLLGGPGQPAAGQCSVSMWILDADGVGSASGLCGILGAD